MDDISYVQETSKEMSRAISCPISFDEDEVVIVNLIFHWIIINIK